MRWVTRSLVIAVVASVLAGAAGVQLYVWGRDLVEDHALVHAIRHDPELMKDWTFLRRARVQAEQAAPAK